MTRVLGAIWYTPSNPSLLCIGFIAVRSGVDPDREQWKCYMGLADGHDEDSDAEYIAKNGIKVTKDIAHAHFPYLKKEDYVP